MDSKLYLDFCYGFACETANLGNYALTTNCDDLIPNKLLASTQVDIENYVGTTEPNG